MSGENISSEWKKRRTNRTIPEEMARVEITCTNMDEARSVKINRVAFHPLCPPPEGKRSEGRLVCWMVVQNAVTGSYTSRNDKM